MNQSHINQYRDSVDSLQEEGYISSTNPSPIISELSQISDFEVIAEQTNLIFPTNIHNQSSVIAPVANTSNLSFTQNSNPVLPSTSMSSKQHSTLPHQQSSFTNLPSMFPQSTNLYLNPLLNMPSRNSRHAPKKFKGKYSDVLRFIQHYNQLLIQFMITDEEDRCNGILEYVSRSVKDFIKSLPDFITPNWNRLQANILKFYDAERDDNRFQQNDLVDYIRSTSTRNITTLGQWKEYYRDFNALAGYLRANGKLSDVEYEGYFWCGIPSALRSVFRDKLEARLPLHNKINPWPMNEIDKIADQHFQRDTFYERLSHLSSLGISREREFMDDSDDSDTDSDSESDSHYQRRYLTRKKRKLLKKKAAEHQNSETLTIQKLEDDRKQKIAVPPEEISNIIQQLNTMSLEDTRYGQLYFQVITMDPTGYAAKCIRRLPLQETSLPKISTYPTMNSPNLNQVSTPPRSYTSFPNNIPLGHRTSNSASGISSNKCFGCFDPQHMLNECPRMNEYLNKGIIKRDPES